MIGPAARRATPLALLLAVAASASACKPEPFTASGTLTDARTQAPLAGVSLTLQADGDCPAVEVVTGPDGAWSAPNLPCGPAWTVTPSDPGWYRPEPAPVGTATPLTAWRAPQDTGVYTVRGTEVTPLVTHTGLDVLRILDSTEEVRFPLEIPGTLPRVAGDTVLLLVGAPVGEATFVPLVLSPERRWFGTKEAPKPVDPWVYLGIRFLDDTRFERVTAMLDPAGVMDVGGPRPLRYIQGNALPAGRYALPTADAARAFLLELGEPPVASPAPG